MNDIIKTTKNFSKNMNATSTQTEARDVRQRVTMVKLDAFGYEMRMGAPLLVAREVQTEGAAKDKKLEERKSTLKVLDYESE
jgi:hypothetical protein